MSLAILLSAATLAGSASPAPPAPPPPDPVPEACFQGWCPMVTWVAYDYNLPAVDADTGEVIRGIWFHCHVPVRWKGKQNKWGHAVCKLVTKP